MCDVFSDLFSYLFLVFFILWSSLLLNIKNNENNDESAERETGKKKKLYSVAKNRMVRGNSFMSSVKNV